MASLLLAILPLLASVALGSALPDDDLAHHFAPDHPVVQGLLPVGHAPQKPAAQGVDTSPAKLFARQLSCDPGYGYCSRTCPRASQVQRRSY